MSLFFMNKHRALIAFENIYLNMLLVTSVLKYGDSIKVDRTIIVNTLSYPSQLLIILTNHNLIGLMVPDFL